MPACISVRAASKFLLAAALAGQTIAQAVEATEGAVASENEVCSKIGADVISKGGNAADSMVATVICIGTVAMYHSGIGGGGFMLIRSSDGNYESIDFRETAPAAAHQDMFNENVKLSEFGGLSVAVPSELRGLEYLHKKYGSQDWADLLAPSIDLARNGFVVSRDLQRYMDNSVDPEFLVEDPCWGIDFAPNGTRVVAGDIMTRKRFADTLEIIAKDGVDAFYYGEIAESTIRAVQADNGIMTMEDLDSYTLVHGEPFQVDYRGYKVTGTHAPSGGVVTLNALKVLDGYSGFDDPSQRNQSAHLLDEAMRFAYGMRTKMGDPQFTDNMTEYTQAMISDETVRKIRSQIHLNETFPMSYYNPDGIESLPTPGTAHISTADKSGLAISLTTTINLIFGSRLCVPETGVIMNDDMNDFSIPVSSNAWGFIPSESNFIRPGKRPQSSTSPIITEKDGRLDMVIGAAGGSRIISTTIQNIINIIDRNMSCQEALSQPRMHDQLSPETMVFEPSYDNSTIEYLRSLGHNVTRIPSILTSAQALRMFPNGTFEAAGEPRQVSSGGAVAYSNGTSSSTSSFFAASSFYSSNASSSSSSSSPSSSSDPASGGVSVKPAVGLWNYYAVLATVGLLLQAGL
ncbi:Gamma-glutamyltranspeptidase 2 light chain [Ceratocystis platani]|uniref:Glutathione hydrolase n=1 Tax=Ceratocystis fimbriata f. sp. platani TaxID=88771 RepID=A0A0F8B2Y3_CERFI|nr:Gamma-glutamyltranspeptidase 2 light chain [Ceratocystis platani]